MSDPIASPTPEVDPFLGPEPTLPDPEAAPAPAAAEPPAEPAPAEPSPIMPAPTEPAPAVTAPVATPAPEPAKEFPWAQLKRHEREAQALRERVMQYEQMLSRVPPQFLQPQAPQQQQQPQPPQIPDWEEDPLGHLKAEQQRMAMDAQRVAAEVNQAQIRSQLAAQEQVFAHTHPDYFEALGYLEQREANRWRVTGVPEEQIPQIIQARAQAMIQFALANGVSVAEAAYAAAKADGYSGPQAPAAPQAQPTTPTIPSQVQQSQARAAIAAGSVSAVPSGTVTKQVLSHEEIGKLSQADMDRLTEQNANWMDELLQR